MKITVKVTAKSSDQVLDAKMSLLNAGWHNNTPIVRTGFWFNRGWETTMYKHIGKK